MSIEWPERWHPIADDEPYQRSDGSWVVGASNAPSTNGAHWPEYDLVLGYGATVEEAWRDAVDQAKAEALLAELLAE